MSRSNDCRPSRTALLPMSLSLLLCTVSMSTALAQVVPVEPHDSHEPDAPPETHGEGDPRVAHVHSPAPAAFQEGAPRLEFFDGLLEPSIGLFVDTVATWSGEEDGREAGADGFLLRGVELAVQSGAGGPLELAALVFLDEEEIELEEAYALTRTALPADLFLRGGRFNLDFGLESVLHDHAGRTLDKSSTVQELLGGTLRGTGVEVGRTSLRLGAIDWCANLGLFQTVDSDVHAVLGPAAGHAHEEEEDDDEGPVREVEDFALLGRVRGEAALDDAVTLAFGSSVLSAPTRTFGVDDTDERNLDAQWFGIDLRLAVGTPDDRGWVLQGEWIHSRQEFGTLDDGGTPGVPGDDTFTVDRVNARGFTGLAEWFATPSLSVGVSGSAYEHAEDSAEDARDIGAFATVRLDPSQRLRFEVRAFDDLPFDDEGTERALDFVAFSVQWTLELGTHAASGHDHAH